MKGFFADLHNSMRQLRKSSGSGTIAVLTPVVDMGGKRRHFTEPDRRGSKLPRRSGHSPPLATLPFQIRWLLLLDMRPTEFACVSAVLAGVAVLGCFIPQGLAATFEPTTASRDESGKQ